LYGLERVESTELKERAVDCISPVLLQELMNIGAMIRGKINIFFKVNTLFW